MSENKKGELIQLFKKNSEDVETGKNITINGNNNSVAGRDIINTNKVTHKTNVTVVPGHEVITEAQAVIIRGLVREIGDLEKQVKAKPKSYASIQSSANTKGGVTQYRLIPIEKFPIVEKFLRGWIGNLTSGKSAPNKIGEEWRKRKYRFIKASCRQFGLEDKLDLYLSEKFGVRSISDLDDKELQKVYLAVSRWKRGK